MGRRPTSVQPKNEQRDVFKEVVARDSAKAARTAFLLYLANAGLIVASTNILAFLVPFLRGPWTPLLQAYVVLLAVYGAAVYLYLKSHPSRAIGVHCYVAGLLGFSAGTLLFAWGGYQLLSTGYWLRQAWSGLPVKCGRDGGEVVIYGQDNLGCRRKSHIVRIGLDVPRNWTIVGLLVFAVGIVFLTVSTFIGEPLSSYVIQQAIVSLISGGIIFGLVLFLQRSIYGGFVRIPQSDSPY